MKKLELFDIDPKEYLTPKQVASELKTSVDTIRRMIKAKKIKAYNLSTGVKKTRYVVSKKEIKEYIKSISKSKLYPEID